MMVATPADNNTQFQMPTLPEDGVLSNSAAGADPTSPSSFDEDDDDKSVEVKPWDEGGSSDCGYSESVHATLMTVGKGVHCVVGAPGSRMTQIQASIGNWFQELSYATRDIWRGDGSSVQQDAANAIKTVMTGGLAEEDDDEMDDGSEKKEDDVVMAHNTTLS